MTENLNQSLGSSNSISQHLSLIGSLCDQLLDSLNLSWESVK